MRNANANKIKMLEQAIASHKAKLPSTSNKDQVRRQILAAETKLREMS
jgi:hypothetical protein